MKLSRYNVWVERDGADFVFNGMTGALLRVPRGGKEAVERAVADPDETDCSVALLEKMALGRMLVGDATDETDLLRTRYDLTRYDTNHFGVTIVASLGCNFDCPYCFEDKHPSTLSEDVQAAIVAALDDQLPKIEQFHVTWFGGEPLIARRAIFDLSRQFIERCDAAGVSYLSDIVTNGYLLDADTCRRLAEARVTFAQIGLDGPPDTHDRMRPLVNGGSTFWRIVENLHHAVEHFGVTIRMNIDHENFDRAEELLQILEAEGLSGKLTVYVGQLVGIDDGMPSPSSSYQAQCFTNADFAHAETAFNLLAQKYGFARASLPGPSSAPCTAVRANELVIGSAGELYKCWDSVGNPRDVIGDIRDYGTSNSRLRKWLAYDPFSDAECLSCIALPVCMGGCAHHAFDLIQHDNRCGTFRHAYREQILHFVEAAESGDADYFPPVELARRMETR